MSWKDSSRHAWTLEFRIGQRLMKRGFLTALQDLPDGCVLSRCSLSCELKISYQCQAQGYIVQAQNATSRIPSFTTRQPVLPAPQPRQLRNDPFFPGRRSSHWNADDFPSTLPSSSLPPLRSANAADSPHSQPQLHTHSTEGREQTVGVSYTREHPDYRNLVNDPNLGLNSRDGSMNGRVTYRYS